MQSAAPMETLEKRGFPQELGKVSMNNSRLSHTLHSADGGNFNQTLREREHAFGLSKSAISERFVLASAQQVQTLLKRDLSKLDLCVLMIDGVEYCRKRFV